MKHLWNMLHIYVSNKRKLFHSILSGFSIVCDNYFFFSIIFWLKWDYLWEINAKKNYFHTGFVCPLFFVLFLTSLNWVFFFLANIDYTKLNRLYKRRKLKLHFFCMYSAAVLFITMKLIYYKENNIVV